MTQVLSIRASRTDADRGAAADNADATANQVQSLVYGMGQKQPIQTVLWEARGEVLDVSSATRMPFSDQSSALQVDHILMSSLIGMWLSISEVAVHVVTICSGRKSSQLLESATVTAEDELSGRPSTWPPSEWRTNLAPWGRGQCVRLKGAACQPVADQTLPRSARCGSSCCRA
jgi:hypothetical protein